MADIYSEEVFNIFLKSYKDIIHEYEKVISILGDVQEYISKTGNPYDVPVNVNDIIKVIDNQYVALVVQTCTVFDTKAMYKGIRDEFVKYYEFINSLKDIEPETDEDKCAIIASVLIMLMKSRDKQKKRIESILLSMCKQPELNSLVQVTSTILNSED